MQPNLLHGVWIAEEGGTFNHNFLLSTSLLFFIFILFLSLSSAKSCAIERKRSLQNFLKIYWKSAFMKGVQLWKFSFAVFFFFASNERPNSQEPRKSTAKLMHPEKVITVCFQKPVWVSTVPWRDNTVWASRQGLMQNVMFPRPLSTVAPLVTHKRPFWTFSLCTSSHFGSLGAWCHTTLQTSVLSHQI